MVCPGVLVSDNVLHHLDVLSAVGIGDQLTGDAGVGACTFSAGDVPGVADHELKVVVLVNTCTYVSVVFEELWLGDLAVFAAVPLAHELHEDIIL